MMLCSNQSPGETAENALGLVIRRVLIAELFVAAILSLAVWFWAGPVSALSIGYGVLLGLVGTLVTGRSVMRTSGSTASRQNLTLLPVYSGTLLKLLIVALGVGVGIKFLTLQPVFLLLGLLASQIAYVFAVLPARA